MLYDRLINAVPKADPKGRENNAGKSLRLFLDYLDERLVQLVAPYRFRLIRFSLATVFIWFGLLKVIGHTPMFDLVAQTVHWLPVPPNIFVPLLGVLEMVVGLGLLFGRGPVLRLSLVLFLLHMSGTFLVLAQPDIAFQKGNPLLLTTEGKFVVKNLCMVTAGLALLSITRGSKTERC